MEVPSVADYLDDATIQDACKKILEYAADYDTMGSNVVKCSEYFTKDTLQVEGQTLEQGIETSGEEIKKIKGYIEDYVGKISAASSAAASRIQTEINRQIAQAGNSNANKS